MNKTHHYRLIHSQMRKEGLGGQRIDARNPPFSPLSGMGVISSHAFTERFPGTALASQRQ